MPGDITIESFPSRLLTRYSDVKSILQTLNVHQQKTSA